MPHLSVNPRRIDLHLHTTASDGKLGIDKLISKCKELSMSIIAITDHDTVKGVMEISNRPYKGITIIPGIELSTYSATERQIHLACYFPKKTNLNPIMDELESIVRDVRVRRCQTILENLAKAGYVIPYSEIEEKTKGRYPSLPIIAECLLEHKYISNTADAYTEFIGDKAPYYVPVKLYPLEDAIQFIHKYKGICAVAHPWLCSNPIQACEEAIDKGIDGIECFPPKAYASEEPSPYRELCKKHGLFCSSGSDFHGITDAEVMIGENVFPQNDADELVEYFKKHSIL